MTPRSGIRPVALAALAAALLACGVKGPPRPPGSRSPTAPEPIAPAASAPEAAACQAGCAPPADAAAASVEEPRKP